MVRFQDGEKLTHAVPFAESLVGITRYASWGNGFSATFKDEPEDFAVSEITDRPGESPEGKYTIVTVRLRNWDTNKFVMRLARDLGIYQDRITYAGTKDKYAVTTQDFCINGVVERLPDLQDVEYLDQYRSSKPIRLGSLQGNSFSVRLKDCGPIGKEAENIYSEIRESGGFPNYYGLQRFGSLRPVTHRVGKFLVRGDFESAVNEYICDPEFDNEDFRLNFCSSRDTETALEEFPQNLVFERTLLKRLEEGDSYLRALQSFPRNLTMLFVHAYQSYIFNRALSKRFDLVKDMKEIVTGDFVIPVDGYYNPEHMEPFLCDGFNVEKLNSLSAEGKVRPVIKLPGYGTKLTDGPMDRVVAELMEEENVKIEDFRVKGSRAISSRGSYRIVSSFPVDFSLEEENVMSFSLGKGIYATVLLREFLKGQVLS